MLGIIDYQHIMADVFTGIKNIQSLLISNDLAGGLRQHNVSIPLLVKVTFLKILDWDFYFDFDCLQYLLAHCVVLEFFALTGSIFKGHPTINCSLQQSPPTCLLFHLKTIEIWSHRMEVEAYMKIVEFFLKNAVVLEDVEVFTGRIPPEHQLKIMRELLMLPSVSKECRVFLNTSNC
ncbi:hypothetical protein SLA2020_396680 [Shorea laevis]